MRYYRITAGEETRIEPIEAEEFRAAIGGAPPDARADFSAMRESTREDYLRRAIVNHSVSGLPAASVAVWRLDEETGSAEGWIISTGRRARRL